MKIACKFRKTPWVFLLALTGLAACTEIPTRDTPNGFSSRNSGWVSKMNIPVFVECVTDGFRAVEQNLMINHTTIQERRTTGYRIEIRHAMSPNILYISADVRDDGFSEIFDLSNDIYPGSPSIRKQGLTSFDVCLKKYGIPANQP